MKVGVRYQRHMMTADFREAVWTALPATVSGGHTRLGSIDIVLVYKVDPSDQIAWRTLPSSSNCLTHSGVSFVSVTQAFNTTSSMGRLTLMSCCRLLSLSEKSRRSGSRDKVAAVQEDGMWMVATCHWDIGQSTESWLSPKTKPLLSQ